MRSQRFFHWFILIAFGIGIFSHPHAARADQNPSPSRQATAYDLIVAMNSLRVSYGLPALIEDPIIDAVAQSTAATMAANSMSWHIGDVRGRIAAAGYGSGGTVWATENFAMSSNGMGIDEIMAVWADADHMRPATTPAYCNVGAGVATANGRTYYILQAAYVSGRECGSSSPSSGGTVQPGSGSPFVSQLIMPVKIATPDADGRLYHVVQAGQSLWSIAIAYQVTIQDLETWNNISRTSPLVSGQRLFIPSKNTEGYSTPTPFGMVMLQTSDASGRIMHEVQPYQSLSTIAEAYHVSVDQILNLNGLQADWPLQVGQLLVISAGNVTPSATLSPIQMLTPETDGKYYHTVQSGETLFWIADQYKIPLADLMTWNGMNNTSVIRPGQKLVLLVTPPATATFTPSPTRIMPSPSPSMTQPPPTVTAPVVTPEPSGNSNWGLFLGVSILILGIGWLLWWRVSRRS